MRRVHLNVGQQRKVISWADTFQMRAKISSKVPATQGAGVFRISEQFDPGLLKERFFRGQRTRLFVLACQFSRFDFAGFNVGLIESIDPDYAPGHCSGDLPAEEFLAEIVGVI